MRHNFMARASIIWLIKLNFVAAKKYDGKIPCRLDGPSKTSENKTKNADVLRKKTNESCK